MHVSTDDALRRVDARWLGVPGFTFPWRPTRYAAYGVGVPIAIVVIFAVTRLFGSGFWPLVYGLCIAIVLTTYLMRLVDDERPASTLPPLIWGSWVHLAAADTTVHGTKSSRSPRSRCSPAAPTMN